MKINFRPTVYLRDRTHTYLWLRDEDESGIFLTLDSGVVEVVTIPIHWENREGSYRVWVDKVTYDDLVPYDYPPIKAFKKYQDSLLERSEEAEAEMVAILALEPGFTLAKRKIRGGTPPALVVKTRSKAPKTPGGGYSLAQLCAELGIDPSEARKTLRGAKIEKPGGKWEWPNAEAAASVRKALGG